MKVFSNKLVIILTLLACCGILQASEQDALLGRKWSLAILEQSAIRLDEFTNSKPYLEFNKDNKFRAFVGCNLITGSYVITPPNGVSFTIDMASISNQSTCKQNFVELENKFVNMLSQVKTWSIGGLTDPVLNLHSHPENIVAIFASVHVY